MTTREEDAYLSLRVAYREYIRWQPDGDWETFLSYAKEESGPVRTELMAEYTATARISDSPMNLIEADATLARVAGMVKETTRVLAFWQEERARIAAGLTLSPRDHLEALRAHAICRAREGKSVEFFDLTGGYVIYAEPCPSKYEKAWELYGNSSSWYEPLERVIERLESATMFSAKVT
jgi:hypothetical protein